ncbi:MAG: ribulose-phosphate 3-epimerase [Bacteroidia bacterium]|nr:ribulose-phosphate 3-epimerase [Bacteroidia bacterium]
MPGYTLAPSILSADFANLQAALGLINRSAADWVHCDVMDGHFVPNLTFGMPVLRALRPHTPKPLDVHLMIEAPERYIDAFADAGADILTVHYEVSPHLHRTLAAIRARGMRPGISLNPSTPVEVLTDILPAADLVLIMSVNPGFGGQQFIEQTYSKLRRLRALADALNPGLVIEVDGGVTLANAGALLAAGATALVAGNAIFGTPDPVATIGQFKAIGPE